MALDNGDRERLRQLERRFDTLEKKGSEPVTELHREVAVLFERDDAKTRTLKRLERSIEAGLERIEKLVAHNEAKREDEEREEQRMGVGRWTLIVMVVGIVLTAIVGAIGLYLQAVG